MSSAESLRWQRLHAQQLLNGIHCTPYTLQAALDCVPPQLLALTGLTSLNLGKNHIKASGRAPLEQICSAR